MSKMRLKRNIEKVLIAEDDIVSAKILEKNVKDWGYQVVLAKDGEDAWNSFKKNAISLIVLDWMMPKISGIELCRKIRRRARIGQPAPV